MLPVSASASSVMPVEPLPTLDTSPLVEKGEYRIVVVRPKAAPKYPASLEEDEHNRAQADFNRQYGGK